MATNDLNRRPGDLLKESPAKTNHTKLSRLLIVCGTIVMRGVLDYLLLPSDLETELTKMPFQQRLECLRRKRIVTQPQWEDLFPSVSPYPCHISLDITLLFTLLREFGRLSAPPKGWNALPDEMDLSLSADLARIKFYRNAFSHDKNGMEVEDDHFKDTGNRIKNCLLRMLHYIGDTNIAEWEIAINNLLNGLDIGNMLANHLREYYRTGGRAILPPLPWMEGHNIRNIYTTTEIVDIDAAPQETTLENLFTKAKTGPDNVRRILIEGEPGIGKSTLCKKIAYDWSTKDDPEVFPNFDIVLSLKCREFHTGDNLWDAIDKQNFTEAFHEKRNEIFKYITNNQNNVLLLLDGYDEIPGNHKDRMAESIHKLISRQLLPYSYVIVTRRPGQDLKLRNQFDKKLEIKGFNLDDSFSFIRDFFSRVPKTAETTISFVMKNNDVKDLVRNPLYTAILCLVLEPKKDNGELYLNQLYMEILSGVTKRYHVEKLGEEVKDDYLLNEVQDILSKLGKISSKLIKEKRSDFEEKELMAIVTRPSIWEEILGLLIHRSRRSHSWERVSRNRGDDAASIREFLVLKKTTDKLRSVSCYSFPKSLKAERLAALAKHYEFKSNLNFIDSAACIRMFVCLCIEASKRLMSVILAFLSTVFAILHLKRTRRFQSNQELNV